MDIFDTVPRKVLTALCESTDQPLYISQIVEKCEIGNRTHLCIVLDKLDEAGMILREQEDGDPESLRRPLRVYCSATEAAISVVRLLSTSA